MSIGQLLLVYAMAVPPSIGLGFVLGQSRGERTGYDLGYHEGQFDAETRQ